MNISLNLRIAGSLMLLLAGLHAGFPKRFSWREELSRLSLLNRQIFVVHCFFIVLVISMIGALSLFWPSTLLEPGTLARIVLSGLVVFWLARLFIQFFVYDARLWRGNHFNTAMHVLFSLMWAYYVFVYAFALWRQYHS